VKLVKQSERTMADLALELGISAKAIGEYIELFYNRIHECTRRSATSVRRSSKRWSWHKRR